MDTSLKPNPPRLNLTPREIEICTFYFVDGKSYRLIAQWLDLSLKTIRSHISNALAKEPALRLLRTQTPRPKIVHLSQIQNPRDIENGPFNPDEL